MDVKMTEEDTNLITYCGLYCGDCHSFKGRIPDLARDLRRELRTSKYDKFAEVISKEPFGRPLRNYKECYEVLGAMVKLRCRRTCRERKRATSCGIWKCCREQTYQGCWECDQFMDCEKLKVLEPLHKDSVIKNLRKIRRSGVDSWLEGRRYW